MADTYSQPKDGWVCFHCGERFLKWGDARDHFGESPDDKTACLLGSRGILMELRKAQQLLRDYIGSPSQQNDDMWEEWTRGWTQEVIDFLAGCEDGSE